MLTPDQARRLASSDLFDPPDDGDPNETPLPAFIGRYRIIRRVASGGMGTVYEAEQPAPKRRVAVKVLRAGVASRHTLRRFRHEAEVLGRLQHPGIAQIHEAGSVDEGEGGFPYFVMEYVSDAMPITRYADDRRLGIDARVDLVLQVCDAIQHGHERGFVHRDLKPDNILVSSSASSEERVVCKVIDFGIARAAESDVGITTMQTEVGRILGTLQYMSPEQCDGKTDAIDGRSDVYSIGVILFELLTGHLPYDLANRSLPTAIRVIMEQEARPPSAFRRGLRGDLETIMLKTIEKSAARRYRSVADLGHDLRRYRRREPILAAPVGRWMKTVRWMGRHPFGATLAACALIFVGALTSTTATVWYLNGTPDRIDHQGRVVRLLSRSGAELHRWTAGPDEDIRFADWIVTPTGPGALIAFATQGTAFTYGQPICVFPVRGDRDTSVWPISMPAKRFPVTMIDAGFHDDLYNCDHVIVTDIFPDRPGEEVVVSLGHATLSPGVIRVFDSGGGLLFQVWNQGHVGGIRWLPTERRLVVQTLDHGVPWPPEEFDAVKELNARVVYAMSPVEHDVRDAFIDRTDPLIAWYKCVWPPDVIDQLGARLTAPNPGEDRDRLFRVAFTLREPPGVTFSLLFDEHGNRVSGGRADSEDWAIKATAAPELDDMARSIWLRDLVEVVPHD